jgi:hypothetical protein
MLAWPNVEVDFSLPEGMFIDTQSTSAVLQDPQSTSNWPFHLTKLSDDAARLTAYTFTLNSSQLPPLNVALSGSSTNLAFGVPVFCKLAMVANGFLRIDLVYRQFD